MRICPPVETVTWRLCAVVAPLAGTTEYVALVAAQLVAPVGST
jgi:hypothetical protein